MILGQAHPPDRHPLRPLRLLFCGKPLRVGHLQRFGDVGPNRIDADAVAADLPTLPLLQGTQVVVSASDVQGVDDTLDSSFKFRYGALSR